MRWVSIPIAALLALLAACQQAPLEPVRARPIKQDAPPPSSRCVMDFWGNCPIVTEKRHAYRWRYVRPDSRPTREREPPREPRHEDLSPIPSSGACQRRLRTVGDEERSQEEALAAAQRAWMGTVRFDYGERFMDLATAQDVRHSCVPSSTGTILKGNTFRCVLEATPCRAGGDR